jgi:hypothetical protein
MLMTDPDVVELYHVTTKRLNERMHRSHEIGKIFKVRQILGSRNGISRSWSSPSVKRGN